MQGYIQVYTGKGKGKTTAALGLAIRAAGSGLKVFFAQFNKRGDYSEIKALKRFSDLITMEQYGLGRFIDGKPSPEDIEAGQNGLKKLKTVLSKGKYQVVILDEANVAVKDGLFSVNDLLDLLSAKPDHVELVITGRNATSQIIDHADLVTEMIAVKHYYNKGVRARVGIEK